ncbi:homing endonuclease associated repeat-containing protein [Hymenobacter sp. PAMC 26628]|uniref:homing endonuclease associated repeat-containing protein n=1 Tax=Hymenobacter sp. PAMC 26628 TaxID=1484118 RepID=UPI0009EBE981|nr:HNH endonuclease [Hymenobacter sp. PAMC 26628]
MKYQLKDFNRNISEAELLSNLNEIANSLGINRLSSRQYDDNGGKYTSGTIGLRFGSWNNALVKAGLKPVLTHNPSKVELLENIEMVWVKLGRQPVSRDMKRPISEFSSSPYIKTFGSFRNSLESFIEYINLYDKSQVSDIIENIPDHIQESKNLIKHKTKRFPSERLKVQVLMRDGNKCRLCGITLTGDNIHFDHIFPWSKGGETVLDNLQVLCKIHNLAKGNLTIESK